MFELTVILLSVLVVPCQACGRRVPPECSNPELPTFTRDPPFDIFPLPECQGWDNMEFSLYVRNRARDILNPSGELPYYLLPSRRTILVIHGFTESHDADWLGQLKDELLQREDCNVIIVDWEDGAGDLLRYDQSASNTRSAGAALAVLVEKMMSDKGISAQDIWCIGFSLGAHVCGHMGMRLSTKIGRITGLDPAGVLFESRSDLKVGLNPTAADFVDVMHTDVNVYGTRRTLGHMDFYPNGLEKQPGCLIVKRSAALERNKRNLFAYLVSCSHIRAPDLFQESVVSDCFVSISSCTDYQNIPGSCSPCVDGSCPVMGYGAQGSGSNGIYYLQTSTSYPPHCVVHS